MRFTPLTRFCFKWGFLSVTFLTKSGHKRASSRANTTSLDIAIKQLLSFVTNIKAEEIDYFDKKTRHLILAMSLDTSFVFTLIFIE